ncbi:MAG: hypothetical protein ACP5QD_02175 [Candidatus Ratteibacteria bacterium]
MNIFILMNKKEIFKRTIVILMAGVLFFGCSREQKPSINIDEKLLQEAIEYGKSKAGVSNFEFMEPWSVYLGYEIGKGRAVYFTPFLHAAQMAKNAAEKHLKPDINIIKKAVAAKSNTLNFLILTYGNEPDTPRRMKAYLIYDKTRVEPVYAHFPPFGEFNRDYYQQINGEVRFSRKDIPENATVKLCIEIIPREEKEQKHQEHEHRHHESEIVVGQQVQQHIITEFVFNLSKYK